MRFLPNRSAGTGRRPLVLAGTAIVWLAGFLPAPVLAQDNAPVPLTKQRLLQTMDLLKGDAADVLIPQIQQRGVSFQMNAADERDLREAGASDKLLTAVRASYRTPPLPPVTGGAPLGVDELSLLLRNGAPASRVEDLVAVRGVSFAAAPAVIEELRAAGASDRLLDLVKLRGAGGVTGQPPPAQTYVAPQPAPPPPTPTPTPTPVSVEPEPVW